MLHRITEQFIEQAVNSLFANRYGRGKTMSISLPNSKTEKKARYKMLVKQGSLSIQQARREYRRYLGWIK